MFQEYVVQALVKIGFIAAGGSADVYSSPRDRCLRRCMGTTTSKLE